MVTTKHSFRVGFFKAAQDAGVPYSHAKNLYIDSINKLGFNDLPLTSDDASDFKDTMRQQGMAPVLGGPEQNPQAQQYNQSLISTRDDLARRHPDIEAVKGGLMGGAAGAGMGGLGGWLGGHLGATMSNPRFTTPAMMKGMPGWGRTAGMVLGAVAGGVPGAINARHKVELARKLEDPRNLDSLMRQITQERQLANNNFQGGQGAGF